MDYSQPGFWLAIGIGGSVIASLSAFQEYSVKSQAGEAFSVKPVFRDFCFGAFLTAIIYMFIPESMTAWMTSVSSSAKSLLPSGSATASANDIELQTGPARF
jgi:hypothetical protein